MAIRPIDGEEMLGITRLLDTDVVRQSKTASWLLDQVLHDIQAMPTLTPPNEPLMWEEFEAMIDKPVYIVELETRNYWALVQQVSDVGVMLTSAIDLHDYGARELYGKTWIAYRRPPEGDADA